MERGNIVYRWIRILHRDIGYFVIGLTIIYCISGITLTYRDTNFLRSEMEIKKTVALGLPAAQLARVLHLRDIKIVSEDEKEVQFMDGVYDKETGVAVYLSNELPLLLRAFNGLHVASTKDSRHWFGVMYGILLLFLALSSFWMYRPGSKLFRRGIVLAVGGMVVSVLLLLA